MARALYSPSFNLNLAIIGSVLIHLVVLAVRFVPPALDRLSNAEPIEVVLVNSKSDTRPLNNFKLAQADLDGGGNTDQNRSLSTPLPNLDDQKQTQQLEDTQQRVVELERRTQQLLTRIQTDGSVSAGDALQQEQSQPTPQVNGDDVLRQVREQERLLAEIKRQTDEYQKRPRRNFIGARTKGVVEAMYIEAFRQKVERIGELHYPNEARRRKLYGSLLLNIEIHPNGRLGMVEIKRSSGSRILDEAALAILRLSEPFPPFPADLRKTTDILVVSRHLSFTSSDRLQAEASD